MRIPSVEVAKVTSDDYTYAAASTASTRSWPMMTRKLVVLACTALVFAGGFVAGNVARAQSDSRKVFELRTYTAPEGKLVDLHKRFRDHTRRIFEKHGMKSVGYWTPQDAPNSQNTLIYILEHPSRKAAKKNGAEFSADPE